MADTQQSIDSSSSAHRKWNESEKSAVRPSVPGFFKGQGILITGGTGFLGKVLIEKLLRSCPDVGEIFVLLRKSQKTKNSAEQRLREEILGSQCFDRLRTTWPEHGARCIAVDGDVGLPDMGLSAADLARIRSSVSVVFHCAATVKFNEQLQTAFKVNVDGVSNLIKVCKSLRRLDALVHVSTAYVSAPNGATLIPETLPPLPLDFHALHTRVQAMSPHQVAAQTDAILQQAGNWPNSYCLTKAIAEHHLCDPSHADLPIIIVRPSIVTCALSEPTPGWIDSLVGPAGLVLAVALGALHAAPGREDLVVDFVPVDMVINALLSAAWYEGTGQRRGREGAEGGREGEREGGRGRGEGGPLIVHCGTSGRNPITWKFMLQTMPPYYARHPSPQAVGPVFFRWVKSATAYQLLHGLFHVTPAVCLDLVASARGQKPVMRRQVARISAALSALSYFAQHQWCFDTSNAARIAAALSADHHPSFSFDLADLIWDVYLMVWCHGMKVFLLKEQPRYLKHSKL